MQLVYRSGRIIYSSIATTVKQCERCLVSAWWPKIPISSCYLPPTEFGEVGQALPANGVPTTSFDHEDTKQTRHNIIIVKYLQNYTGRQTRLIVQIR